VIKKIFKFIFSFLNLLILRVDMEYCGLNYVVQEISDFLCFWFNFHPALIWDQLDFMGIFYLLLRLVSCIIFLFYPLRIARVRKNSFWMFNFAGCKEIFSLNIVWICHWCGIHKVLRYVLVNILYKFINSSISKFSLVFKMPVFFEHFFMFFNIRLYYSFFNA